MVLRILVPDIKIRPSWKLKTVFTFCKHVQTPFKRIRVKAICDTDFLNHYCAIFAF